LELQGALQNPSNCEALNAKLPRPNSKLHVRAGVDNENSACADVDRFYIFTTGELLDPAHDFVAMHEEFVANDGMSGEDNEPVAFDHAGVGIGGIRRANEGRPVLTDGVFGRLAADLVFLQELLNHAGK
jgi:hypothetical protein